MIHTGDLDALPKGHAFALLAGRLYKLRLPLFDDAGPPSGAVLALRDRTLQKNLEKLVAEKRAQYESAIDNATAEGGGDFPEGAQLCAKCHTKAAIQMDGCLTCLNCGESKCG